MSDEFITSIFLAVQQHPYFALLFVYLIAFSESLIVIGLVVPGAILMVLFGALIATGALDFWLTIIFAVLGAVSGDSLSYWLGRRYKDTLLTTWPLSRHPDIVNRAEHFFIKHGVKSIIFSRFIGPLRPIIPAIAGMSKMSIKHFLIANIISAILWAPIYLLPGILFGLSIEIARDFAGKFILIMVMLLAVIIFVLWAIQKFYLFVRPHNDKFISNMLKWGKQHPVAGQIPSAIFDEKHSEVRGLSLLALLILTLTGILVLLRTTLNVPYNPFSYNLDALNSFIYYSLQIFRSPPFDLFMLWLNYLTSSRFISALYLLIGLYFIFRKHFSGLWHWLAAVFLPLLLTPLLYNPLTKNLSANSLYQTETAGLPFIVVVATYGFLTVIINTGFSYQRQKNIYYIFTTLVTLIALSQLYYAQQVFSQIISGLIIGFIWFSLLGIAYRRHTETKQHKLNYAIYLFLLGLFTIYPAWQTIQHKDYSPAERTTYLMGTDSWLESGWEILPIIRKGIYTTENQFFNLQWAETKENIESQLLRAKFNKSTFAAENMANWFLKNPSLNQLPVLPHIHNGMYETLLFYRYFKNTGSLIVVRLWPSVYRVKQDSPAIPLWFGSISTMKMKTQLGISYLISDNKTKQDIKDTLAADELSIITKTVTDSGMENNIYLLKKNQISSIETNKG